MALTLTNSVDDMRYRQLESSHIVWSPLAQGVLTGKYEPGGETLRRIDEIVGEVVVYEGASS